MSLLDSCAPRQIVAVNNAENGNEEVVFTDSYALPPGCTLQDQQVIYNIQGETFGPYFGFPQNIGPLAGGPNAGLTFTVSGTFASHVISPDAAFVSPIPVQETYIATSTDCGIDSSIANGLIESVPRPVRAFVNSDDSVYSAVVVSTGGSLAADGLTNIADDPTAFFEDIFNWGACGSTVLNLFKVSGNAGDTISSASFSDWNPIFSTADRLAIIAGFVGQIGDAAGAGAYAFDKEIIRDILVGYNVVNDEGNEDGDQMCIDGYVTHAGETSPVAQYEVKIFCEFPAALSIVVGYQGPLDVAGWGRIIAFGRDTIANNSISSFAGSLQAVSNTHTLWASGVDLVSPARHQFQSVLALEAYTDLPTYKDVFSYVNMNEIYYAAAFVENDDGLQSFGNYWQRFHENPDASQPEYVENRRMQGLTPNWWQFGGGVGDCEIRFFAGDTSVSPTTPSGSTEIADDVITCTGNCATIEVNRYPTGTPGINITGSENPDPALSSSSPQSAELAAGGVAATFTPDLFGSTNSVVVKPDLSGDYYIRITKTGDQSGLPYQFISSFRYKVI